MKKKFKLYILLFIVVVLLVVIFCYKQNNSIVITKLDYLNSNIPAAFNNFQIVHISDLHNTEFGKNQEKLLKKIAELSPDIIVVTGDLIDRRRYNLDIAMEFIDGAINIAPVYYVSGNHEAWSNKYAEISERLLTAGVYIMDNNLLTLNIDDAYIDIAGLRDPAFLTKNHHENTNTSEMNAFLQQWASNDNFCILLCHRPELFNLYIENNIDLIFTGHAHGGQIRLPFLGAFFAPNQGFLPQYTDGAYTQNSSTLIVSRGLGNSLIPLRLFNKPEIIAVTLKN